MKKEEIECNQITKNEYGNYGKATFKAHCKIKMGIEPCVAWDDAIKELSCSEKGCAKATFLGLCQAGLVKYVEQGKYTRSELNKNYAIEALELLNSENIDSIKPIELWRKLKSNKKSDNDTTKAYNDQMHVVLKLWHEELIYRDKIAISLVEHSPHLVQI